MKVTKINEKGIDMIKFFEGFKEKPYLCSAGVPTIGFGTTIYPNGVKVTLNDKPITKAIATQYLLEDIAFFERGVDAMTTDLVNENQFSALVSFAYNLGLNNLKNSTLLKKVNINPNDDSIKIEFLKWTKAAGRIIKGLITRRNSEKELYFTK